MTGISIISLKVSMAASKVKVAIIGTGNIGSDLLSKVERSPFLRCSLFTGRNQDSQGIRRAKQLDITVSYDSIAAIENNPDCCDIVFDATNAESHKEHAPILKKLGKFVIDLTPSRVGTLCVPLINIDEAVQTDNINLVTCGGQSLIPIAKAIMEVHPETQYIEAVGSIASRSAGPGTRANIEEYINTTARALEVFSGVPKAKAILILNPAEPPILMHNTIYASITNPKLAELKDKIFSVAKAIQAYVPGYRIAAGPIVEKGNVMVIVEVVGQGDYLPTYAGNLDIITCAAVRVAEEYAQKKLNVSLQTV